MRIVLKQERMLYILKNPILLAPDKDVGEEVRTEYQHHINNDEHATCVMLANMSPKL